MTTFEITVIVLLAAIVVLLIVLLRTVIEGFHGVWQKLDVNCETLSSIRGDTLDILQELNNIEDNILDVCNQQQNAWACDMTTIVKGINELNDVIDKMHRNLCVEIADKMVDRVYPPTYVTPCYAPNGICTNPQMDCINCPKRGTGGTWSTSTNISKNDE